MLLLKCRRRCQRKYALGKHRTKRYWQKQNDLLRTVRKSLHHVPLPFLRCMESQCSHRHTGDLLGKLRTGDY